MIEQQSSEKIQITAAKISLFGSIAMFLISAVIGIAVDSITLILDASGSLVIFGVALLMHKTIRKINMPPDDFYHFGYGKYEPMTVVVQSCLIIAVCIVSLKFAIQDIIHAEDITNYNLAVAGTFTVGIIGVVVATYLRFIALRTGSAVLRTASIHWTLDTFMSFAIFAGFFCGLLLKNFGYSKITPYIDPVMAMILAVVFICIPIKEMTKNALELLDAAPERGIREKVKKVAEQYKPKSFGIHRLRARKAGKKIFIDICFLVDENLTISDANSLAENFERDLKGHLPHCDVVVYFKPIKK